MLKLKVARTVKPLRQIYTSVLEVVNDNRPYHAQRLDEILHYLISNYPSHKWVDVEIVAGLSSGLIAIWFINGVASFYRNILNINTLNE